MKWDLNRIIVLFFIVWYIKLLINKFKCIFGVKLKIVVSLKFIDVLCLSIVVLVLILVLLYKLIGLSGFFFVYNFLDLFIL